ncbi:transcriptional regulator of RNA polII, SAGA, subunit-domain-containing protein [Catenaria anguillulae PL171]|uniref:Transcriptional regulator of RNA polII, SAGA, subunit-domain-containing protein n=1 Tax=Catenaria anguillulae PL171 TaxID=765915 RepID=A0A1Y2H945_9FUNG|nr:transcriptional regulator of RNA polII, SAGA, subunit-domain-containing protein [Catenaria anguillulae PL171]
MPKRNATQRNPPAHPTTTTRRWHPARPPDPPLHLCHPHAMQDPNKMTTTTAAPSPSIAKARAQAATSTSTSAPAPPSTPTPRSPSAFSSPSSLNRVTSPRKTPTSTPKTKRSSTFTSTSLPTEGETTTSTATLLPPSTLFRNLSNVLSESCHPNPQHNYSTHLARYLRGDMSKCEFQALVLDLLPPDAIAIHNNLILSLLRSVLTVPPPPPPPPPTTPPPPRPSSASSPPLGGDSLVSPGLSTLDFASHPLPYPRKRRATHEPADTRRTRTRKEAVALPKDDRDRLRRELLAMDPDSGTASSVSASASAAGVAAAAAAAGASAGGDADDAGTKKKKKSKRAAAAAAAALAATLSNTDRLGPHASSATPNPFTHPGACNATPSLAPGLDLFGDPPLHGYAYPPTPPPSSSSSSSSPADDALPLIATSRARHAEYMRLVHNMHLCRVQGDLPGVRELHDRITCVMWEQPGGKVDKVGPGVVELMMFGLRTYLKEVVEGMVRVGRVGEKEEEVRRDVADQAAHEQLHQQAHTQGDEETGAEQEQAQEQEQVETKMDVDDEVTKDQRKLKQSNVSAAALALLTAAGDGKVQSWSARSAPPPAQGTRQRSTSTSNGTSTATGAAPWAGKTIRRPSSFTAPPASSPIAAPLDSPTVSSSTPSSLVRTHSARSVTSNPSATTTFPLAAASAAPQDQHQPQKDIPPPLTPLAPRDRVLTLNHLATALALEPVLAGDARHVADRVLAKLWHATPQDEEVARWRGEMRSRVRAKEEEAAGGAMSE